VELLLVNLSNQSCVAVCDLIYDVYWTVQIRVHAAISNPMNRLIEDKLLNGEKHVQLLISDC